MAIYVEFLLNPAELSCVYDGKIDEQHWKIIKQGIEKKTFYLTFVHRPTLFFFKIEMKDLYDGQISVAEKCDGVLIVSGAGKAKIDGSAKVVKQVESTDPHDMSFSGVGAVAEDFSFGGMSLASGDDNIDALVKISSKKI
jgi:hypothetical protein